MLVGGNVITLSKVKTTTYHIITVKRKVKIVKHKIEFLLISSMSWSTACGCIFFRKENWVNLLVKIFLVKVNLKANKKPNAIKVIKIKIIVGSSN